MRKHFTLILFFALLTGYTSAQEKTSTPVVAKATYFDVSPPLRDMVQSTNEVADRSWKEGYVKNITNTFSNPNEKADGYIEDPIRQSFFGAILTDTTIQNYDGVSMSGLVPPDTDGDVGPNNYFQVVNVRFAIYNKSGTMLLGPSLNSSIFSGLPHNSNDGDAVVLYDENADRWLFSQFSLPNYPNGPFYENVAISQTSDPTGSWYRYQFTFSDMPDYPKLSVWGDGYYMTIRRFSAGSLSWIGPAAVAMDRTQMLAGNPAATIITFNLPSSCDGPLSADCDSDFPPDSTPCPVCYLVGGTSPVIKINSFHADWTNPSNSTFTLANSVSVSPFSYFTGGAEINQKGTGTKLDPMSSKKIMFRMPFRKFTDHWSMLLSTTVKLTGSVAGIRWMEVRNTGSGWSLYQEGTYSPDTKHRWMGSIAMDSIGNIALGYSISSSAIYPAIRYTGRMNGDPLGVMTIAERGIFNGTGSQTYESRWGDYSAMNADPTEIGKFWYTQEYIAGGNWKTRIASFSFADLIALTIFATPDTLCLGSSQSTQLNAEPWGGSFAYTYSWTSDPPGFTSDQKSPVASPLISTQYFCTVNDGTQSKTDTIFVNVLPAPTAFAGNDTSYCWYVPAFVVSGEATNYTSLLWTTAGDGNFSNPSAATTTYIPGSGDRTSGSVTLTFSASITGRCPDTTSDDIFIILDPCTGISEPATVSLGVTIQPNPTKDNFLMTITGHKNSATSITITDIQGRTVFSENLRPDGVKMTKRIDVSNYSRGIYLVKVQTEGEFVTERLVIQ